LHIAHVLGPLLLTSVPPPRDAVKPTVYLMSDERAVDFFEPLSDWFNLKQASSFPQLGRLAKTDPVLLYEVEKRIFDDADLRLHTFRHELTGAVEENALSRCVLTDVRHIGPHIAHERGAVV